MSTQNQVITPDQLLEAFRGRSLKSIILFTLIVHLVIIGGSSVPYFIKSATEKSDSKLSEKERSDLATSEATAALREIATKHGIKPQDLSSRLAGGAAPKPAAAEEPKESKTEGKPTTTAPEEAEQPKSAIEEQLEVKETGPTVPPIPTEEVDDDDLFK
jgi:membrane-bound lytic murein transglycosylase B